MSFFDVLFYSLPIAKGQAQQALRQVGRRGHAFRGPVRDRRRKKDGETYSFATPLIPFEEAEFLMGLVSRKGHRISGDSRWSDDGIYINGDVAENTVDATYPLSAYHNVLQVGGDAISSDLELDIKPLPVPLIDARGWTVGFYRKTTGGTWEHWIKRSDGAHWKDGVKSAGTFPTSVTLGDSASNGMEVNEHPNTINYGEIVLLPFWVPDAQCAAWYSWHASFKRWSSLPYLTVSGDYFDDDKTHTALGAFRSASYGVGNRGGMKNNLLSVSGVFEVLP